MTRHYRTMCLESDQTCQRGISKPSQTAIVNEPKPKPSHPTSQPHTPTQSLHSMGAIPPNPFTPWVPSPIPSFNGCHHTQSLHCLPCALHVLSCPLCLACLPRGSFKRSTNRPTAKRVGGFLRRPGGSFSVGWEGWVRGRFQVAASLAGRVGLLRLRILNVLGELLFVCSLCLLMRCMCEFV